MNISFDLRQHSYKDVNSMLPALKATNPSTLYVKSAVVSTTTADNKTLPLHFFILQEEEEMKKLIEECTKFGVKLVFDVSVDAMGTKTVTNKKLLSKYLPKDELNQQLSELDKSRINVFNKKHFLTRPKSFLGIHFRSKLNTSQPRLLNLSKSYVVNKVNDHFNFLLENNVRYVNLVHHTEDASEDLVEVVNNLILETEIEVSSAVVSKSFYEFDSRNINIVIPKYEESEVDIDISNLDSFAFDIETSKILNFLSSSNKFSLEYSDTNNSVYVVSSHNQLILVNNNDSYYKFHSQWGQLNNLKNINLKTNQINAKGYFVNEEKVEAKSISVYYLN